MWSTRWKIAIAVPAAATIAYGLAQVLPDPAGVWSRLVTAVKIRPTYPAGQVADGLKRLCKEEYHLSLQARRQGNTLQALLWHGGVLKRSQLEIKPEAAESLERILLCATRIALSTDAPLDFIEVKVADIVTGASITLWRYVPDIRDSMYTRIAEEEYFNRLVIEIYAPPKEGVEEQTLRWDRPITFREFLAKQIVFRAKRLSPVSLQAHEDLSEPASLVVVIDNWASVAKAGAKEKEDVPDLVAKAARTVIHGYRFSGFRDIVLRDGRGTRLGKWTL
jgi:hypothetical protein